MTKRILSPTAPLTGAKPDSFWLDLEALAEFELTSEDPAHPIEDALRQEGCGWRAGSPGRQLIRLLFGTPRSLRRIQLHFRETEAPRTQEFVLRWAGAEGEPKREILRQQYHFSPGGANEEREDYTVQLEGVAQLELEIIPEIGGGAIASLAALQLA